jgi:hypothetical protein
LARSQPWAVWLFGICLGRLTFSRICMIGFRPKPSSAPEREV